MSQKPSDRARKRSDVILKTANLLKDRSFDSITVRMICKSAGISIGTFYHYFDRKENVATDIFRLTDEYIVGTLLPTLTSDDEIANIVRFCTELARFAEEQGVPYSRALNSFFPRRESYAADLERQRPLFSELRNIIRRGIEKKQIDPSYDPDGLTDELVLFLHGLDFDWAKRDGEYGLTEKTRFLITQIVGLLRHPFTDPSIYC